MVDDVLPPPESSDELPPPVEGGRISGRVTDFEGHALVGVRVEVAAAGGGDLDLLPTMTDGEGRFLLEGLGDGRYDLRFLVGRVRARTLAVPAGTEDVHVQLARPQGILLVVKTPEGRPAPAMVHVRLEREGRDGGICEYLGRHVTMRMLLWSIRPGTYRVSVWGGAWLPVEAPGVKVLEGRPAPEVEVLLSVEGGYVRGRVEDATGRPVPYALVAWRPLDRKGPWPPQERAFDAAPDGTFRIDGLPAGRYLVSAGPLTGPFADVETTVDAESTAEVTVRLS